MDQQQRRRIRSRLWKGSFRMRPVLPDGSGEPRASGEDAHRRLAQYACRANDAYHSLSTTMQLSSAWLQMRTALMSYQIESLLGDTYNEAEVLTGQRFEAIIKQFNAIRSFVDRVDVIANMWRARDFENMQAACKLLREHIETDMTQPTSEPTASAFLFGD